MPICRPANRMPPGLSNTTTALSTRAAAWANASPSDSSNYPATVMNWTAALSERKILISAASAAPAASHRDASGARSARTAICQESRCGPDTMRDTIHVRDIKAIRAEYVVR